MNTIRRLPRTGNEVRLFTHMSVREDAVEQIAIYYERQLELFLLDLSFWWYILPMLATATLVQMYIFGYLPEEVQKYIAERLKISHAEVYGVISFYSYFTDKPVGRYKINVCIGTACFVKGAGKVLEEFKRHLNIKEGETSEDGKFFLGSLRCVGACSLAPVVMVNDRVYGNVTAEKVSDILKECTD